MSSSPFLIDNIQAYKQWRNYKLSASPNFKQVNHDEIFTTIENAQSINDKERLTLSLSCNQNSMALYRLKKPSQNTKKDILLLAKQMGLNTLDSNLCADEDSLTSVTKTSHKGQHEYIPYSNKRLSWHTDGYYNTTKRQINGMLLHCASPAHEGGESLLLDHEIAYLLLRDENPDYIEALMQADALTIPANILDGKIIRDVQTGPVFSISNDGKLHMRYSARQRNIEWKQNTPTLEAVSFLKNLWEDSFINNSPHILRITLQAGEGVICNNILHCRTAFVDSDDASKKRLLYRGRYYDRVQD